VFFLTVLVNQHTRGIAYNGAEITTAVKSFIVLALRALPQRFTQETDVNKYSSLQLYEVNYECKKW
jgi:hypothetical protein